MLNVVTSAFFVLIAVLEYLLPHREDWRASDGQVLHDLGHSWFGTGLGGLAGNLTIGFLAPLLAAALWGGQAWWPSDLPFVLQLGIVYLVADFGRYWQHRIHHLVPFLWRFHALHHSVERMSVFKTSRSHFVERYLQQVFMFGLLILLGCPLEMLVWYIIPNSVIGLLDHSNLDVQLGPLERVIMGPKGHRLHHSAAPEDMDTNFGSAIVLWDVVFRTFRDPTRVPQPEVVGIRDDPIPSDFLRQYFSPFLWARLTAPKPALEAAPEE
ncbi:MAG: sterol desaturase family protein [Planctomycetes bacterium]|nr:sterol desaturase family protein [Planctomycetota bacterium]